MGKLIIVIFVASFLRFTNLGTVPDGLSLNEAQFGIYLSKLTGVHITNLFLLRFPFAILGTITVLLSYLVVRKFTGNSKLSLTTSLVIATSPLFLQESRIFSLGTLILLLILAFCYIFSDLLKKYYRKITLTIFSVSILVFAFSIFKIPENAGNEVNKERNIAASKVPTLLSKVFSNKITQSYWYKEKLVFEHLDIGNYFFSGYPRQRWGIEENLKFYPLFLPLLFWGVVKSNKQAFKYFSILFFSMILLLSALELRTPEYSIFPAYLLSLFVGLGLYEFVIIKKLLLFKIVFLFFLLLEALSFLNGYNLNLRESDFSPRRTVFKELTEKIAKNCKYCQVFMTSKLTNVETFIEFYNPNLRRQIYFEEFDSGEAKGDGHLFVSVLPHNASPAEKLYKKNGYWPEHIEVLEVITDKKMKQDIVIFRSLL